MNRIRNLIALLTLLTLMQWSWEMPVLAEEHADEHGDEAGNPLEMNVEKITALNVQTAVVDFRTLTRKLTLPAEVKMNAYRSAVVTTRITAQVLTRLKKLGDHVEKGDVLLTLSSVAMAEAQGELIVSDREWQRVRKLGEKAVSAKRYMEARIRREQAAARVMAYGMTRDQAKALMNSGDATKATGEFELLAPVSGIVLQDDFVTGELVEPGKVLFSITDESTVWVEARTLPVNLADIEVGATARIQTGDGSWLEGNVVQIHHQLDETTRTQALRIEVSNKRDLLHPGQFVEADVLYGSGVSVLAIPDSAMTLLNDSATVFKLEGDGELVETLEFHPEPIETGESSGGWTEIKDGLSQGDVIAIEGVFTLKSLLLKSFIGDEH